MNRARATQGSIKATHPLETWESVIQLEVQAIKTRINSQSTSRRKTRRTLMPLSNLSVMEKLNK